MPFGHQTFVLTSFPVLLALLIATFLPHKPSLVAANLQENGLDKEGQSHEKGEQQRTAIFGDREREKLLRKVLRQSGFNTDEEIDEAIIALGPPPKKKQKLQILDNSEDVLSDEKQENFDETKVHRRTKRSNNDNNDNNEQQLAEQEENDVEEDGDELHLNTDDDGDAAVKKVKESAGGDWQRVNFSSLPDGKDVGTDEQGEKEDDSSFGALVRKLFAGIFKSN